MDRFMTAQEIADAARRLGLSCMPKTKRGVNLRAKNESWDALERFARKRAGSSGGGGVEYHVSLLPEPMQAALAAEVSRQVTVRNTAERREVEAAKREALDTTALTARQREVMNARSQILSVIENVLIAEGRTRSQTVDLFLDDDHRFGVGAEVLAVANDRKSGGADVSRRTILRWFQYRDTSGIGALAPKATKAQADIPAWFWDFLKYYARPQKPCLTEALDDYLREASGVNEPVTYSKVRRLIDRLGNVEKHRGREGSLTLKARMAYVTRSTGDLLPTCIFTADGKTFDAEVAHPLHGRPFRPEITSVVDVATRKCVGFSIGLAENAVGVADALRFACETHGIPAIFYVDRGSGFKNHMLDGRVTGILGRLGATKLHSFPQNSQARGIIERFQGTVWNKLARQLDTYVGAPMDRQARQKSFKITRKDIKEFGQSASLLSWDDFLEACRAAIKAYNARSHSELPHKMSPDECWAWHVQNGFEPVTVTKTESDDLFRPYVKRKVSRCLISFNSNKYFSLDLTEFDGDEVMVGYDIHNADHVWVREIDTKDGEECAGRLICIAKFGGNEERYVPLTMERTANERRAKAASARLQEKLDRVQEELRPTAMIEAQVSVPMSPIQQEKGDTIDASFARVGEGSEVAEARAGSAAPRFATDAELAAWVLTNADAAHASQLGVLRDCVSDPVDRQLLQDHGVDVPALIALLNRAA